MAILESLPVALALAIVFIVVALALALLVLVYGMHLGQKVAVDHTRAHGSFQAYGKWWVATELEPQQRGHVPPRPMPPPSPARHESEAPR